MTVIAVVLAATLLPAAADAGFIAETRDAAGDSTSAEPAHDLLAAGFGYDRRSGQMAGAIALKGAPSGDTGAFVTLWAGKRTANGCSGIPVAGFGAFTDGWTATWARQDTPGKVRQGEADKSGYRSTVQYYEVRDRRLRGQKWDCLEASLRDREDPSIVYDSAPIKYFKGIPALALRMPTVRRAIPPNRVRKLRVVLRNPGDGPLRKVRLKFRGTRGLKVAPRQRMIRLIRPRTRKAIWVKVRLFRSAGTSADLKVFARSGKLRAEAETEIRLKLPKKPSTGGGSGSGGGGGVCVQYFPDLSGETGGSLGLVPC